jgi:hypothetical protein
MAKPFGALFEAPIAHHPLTLAETGGPACLASLPIPGAIGTPARDMTRREARDVAVHYLQQGAFTLKTAWTPLRFGTGCTVASPTPATRIAIEPPVIDGVTFRSRNNPRGRFVDNLDARMVVLLCRLAYRLRTKFGVTEIHHLGIGHGRGGADDCHNTGRAIDFAGVVGIGAGGAPYDLDVLRDWGRQPVTMPDGRALRDWPTSFTATTYRLPAGTLAHAVFSDVYQFGTEQATDTSQRRFANGAPTTIGRASRFIIHPDHPNQRLRAAHRDHIHMQIGPTGREVTPP